MKSTLTSARDSQASIQGLKAFHGRFQGSLKREDFKPLFEISETTVLQVLRMDAKKPLSRILIAKIFLALSQWQCKAAKTSNPMTQDARNGAEIAISPQYNTWMDPHTEAVLPQIPSRVLKSNPGFTAKVYTVQERSPLIAALHFQILATF